MYMLVPDEPNLGFVTVAVIFVAATAAGLCQPCARWLGVFDAAMMVALCSSTRKTCWPGLLLFRLLYYIIPFVISLAILGVREFLLSRSPRRIAQTAPPPIDISRECSREKSDVS